MAIGLTLGVVGALSISRLMQRLLFGIEPHDPVTLATVAHTRGACPHGA